MIQILALCLAIGALPQTFDGGRGCFEQVIVVDPQTRRVRCFEREETGHKRPGTGTWGRWQERTVPHRNSYVRMNWRGDEAYRTGKRAYAVSGAGPGLSLRFWPVDMGTLRRLKIDRLTHREATASRRHNWTGDPDWDWPVVIKEKRDDSRRTQVRA